MPIKKGERYPPKMFIDSSDLENVLGRYPSKLHVWPFSRSSGEHVTAVRPDIVHNSLDTSFANDAFPRTWDNCFFAGLLEATPGIEPGCADLQSATSPLRHVAVRNATDMAVVDRSREKRASNTGLGVAQCRA